MNLDETIIPREVNFTISTTSQEVSPNSSKQRSVLIFTNTSTAGQKISLAWGKPAVSGIGVVLLPGEHHVESIDKGFRPLNLAVNAISDAANGTLALHERVLNDYNPGV